MSNAAGSSIREARTAHKMKLTAKVTDAEFDLLLDELTEVLAEPADTPEHFEIAWPYGLASASATVHRSSLLF